MQDTTLSHSLAEQRERLMNDLRVVMADAEELLRSTAGEVGGQSSEMRSRLLTRLSQARRDLGALQQTVVSRAREVGTATDGFVRENPWKAVGAATGVGLLVGLLLTRR